ncbi:MAG: hypothetical protein CVT73_13645 [Alphaproteobacteria bacterium HGW-Alphaproteobacteria-12]|nr:MAG: hypothetical protein CVT73_13645 [Alphaproteobacteria bacterium HGW-Alphaproteobacteria-12]
MTDRSLSRRPLPTRRDVLALGMGAALLIAAPSIVRADAPYKRTLKLQSLNSGEKLTVTYWTDKGYQAGALKRVRWFMRDLRTGDLHDVDPRLLDLLWEIDRNTRSKNPIYAMSGYRSPETNDWLFHRGNGVDPGSFHMRGMAMDITQDFNDPEEVYRVAKKLGRGGAGFYPTRTPYAHVDVGPPDAWVYPGMPRPGRDKEYDHLQAMTVPQTDN